MRDASIQKSHLPYRITFIRYGWVALGTALLLAGGARTSTAGTINLTNGGSGSGLNLDVSGQLFFSDWVNSQSTGTGVINSFVRIDSNNNPTEMGYNTSNGTPMDDQPGHDKAITLADVKTTAVVIGGVTYYRFLLDINQTGSQPLISLNQVQIFADSVDPPLANVTASSTTTPVATIVGATEVFRMDSSTYPVSGSGTEINMNANLNSGSGSGDMMLFVNSSLFSAYSDSTDIILFSQFGNPPGQYAQNDGFEEWALFSGPCITISCGVPPPPPSPAVPEPASLVLLGTGLFGAVVRYRRSRS